MERKETVQLHNDAGDISCAAVSFPPPPPIYTPGSGLLGLWVQRFAGFPQYTGTKENWWFRIVTTKTFCVFVKQNLL